MIQTVAGVDGCRGGWVVVRLANRVGAEVVDRLDDVVAEVRTGALAAVAIDMPIGLLTDRPRACDREARRVLGSRRSTVFPAPVRAVLAATDYGEACALSRAASGRALSRQAFNLVPAIRQLDEILGPDDQDRIVEAHPECAFARMTGEALPTKHGADGRRLRIAAIREAFGVEPADLAAEAGAPIVDLLDAAANAVTARHLVAGSVTRLGGELDPTGKRAEIVY